MYLSRLCLNPRSRWASQDAESSYNLHRTISRAFPHDPPRSDERVLFRLNEHPRTHALTVLVQSRFVPDWSFLQTDNWQGYLLPATPTAPNPWVKQFEPQYVVGQVHRFRLHANPTRKTRRNQGEGAEKVRLSLFKEEDQTDWLRRKLQSAGSELLNMQIVPHGLERNYKTPHGKQTHFAVLFEGLLRVTDPAALRSAVENGIGSAKGYGFGLLSLAPA